MAEVLTLATQAVNDDDHEEDNSNVWGRMIPLQNDLQCLGIVLLIFLYFTLDIYIYILFLLMFY